MRKIDKNKISLTGEITGGDEYRIDPHADPGAIFLDHVDLVRVLDTKKYDGQLVNVTIEDDAQVVFSGQGKLSVEQGFGTDEGYGLKKDQLVLETFDEDVDILELLLQEAGWTVTFTCERLRTDEFV